LPTATQALRDLHETLVNETPFPGSTIGSADQEEPFQSSAVVPPVMAIQNVWLWHDTAYMNGANPVV
jgi:hypothetical protein